MICISPTLFNIFFAAAIEVVIVRFSEDEVVMQNLVHLEEDETITGPRTPLDQVRRAVWGMLYADDAGVVPRSADGLARMMTIVVEVFGKFGLTVSEKKTETLLMRVKEKKPSPSPPSPPLVIEAAGQTYAQTAVFKYLGGLVTEHGDLIREINFRNGAASSCMRRYGPELYDRPRAPFRLKVRFLQAEPMEALLYGCMTWAPRIEHYLLLSSIHLRLLWRVIGYRRKRDTYRQLSYAQALKRVGCQSVEATVRQRHLLFAGALARQPDGRLPKRLMFGTLMGGENPGGGRPPQDWERCLKENLKAFGIPSDEWETAAKVEGGGPRHEEVLRGAERFMISWHKDEEEASRKRAIDRDKKRPSSKIDTTTNSRRKRPKTSETGRDVHQRAEAEAVVRHCPD